MESRRHRFTIGKRHTHAEQLSVFNIERIAMPIVSTLKRIAGLEAAQQPLQRAYALIRRNVHPRQWDTPALEAFTRAECQDLRGLSEEALEARAFRID